MDKTEISLIRTLIREAKTLREAFERVVDSDPNYNEMRFRHMIGDLRTSEKAVEKFVLAPNEEPSKSP